MNAQVKAVPEGYHTATPSLVIRGAARAIEFYQKAFGAQELFRMPGPGGIVLHAEIQIGDSRIMLTDESPRMGNHSPESLQGTPVGVFLYTEDADAFFQRAVAAGARPLMPVQQMPWGDRFGMLADPFGHEWQVATHVEDVSFEEMRRRMASMTAE